MEWAENFKAYNQFNTNFLLHYFCSTAKGMRERQLHKGEKFYQACNKVFCGWDFSLTDAKAADYKKKNLYAEYMVY